VSASGPDGSPAAFRAGFVSITGLPNVGKSTLLNALLGTRLSIISPKPQTTRNNIKGILNTPGHQTVFVDTPGMLSPRNLFEKTMCGAIHRAASEDSDLALLVVEPRVPPADKLCFFEQLRFVSAPLYLVINKIDLLSGPAPSEPDKAAAYFASILPVKKTFCLSALGGKGVKELRQDILETMPEHPPYYPVDQMTDRWERFYAAELIREQIFSLFSDEIPYAAAVEIEVFREAEGSPDYILAAVHVARQTQKPIIIGKGGRMIKELREKSEKALAGFLGRPVKLELQVKVTADWQNNPGFLRDIGLREGK
jgi:GTP-binding protein Era